MDLRPTESQQLLITTARDFFQRHCPLSLVQSLALEARGFPDELWRRISDLGWPGLLIPGEHGGSDGMLLDIILLVEEMGRACFPSPYIHSAIVSTSMLLAAGSRDLKNHLLPAMARGERLCTLAVVEESASFEPEALTMIGEVGGRINGSKLFVKDAHIVDHLIVVVRGGGAFNLVMLDKDHPGITLLPLDTMSGEKLFEVHFSAVELRQDVLLGRPGGGWKVLAPALQWGALARSAEMVGCAQRILDICVEYAKVRVQSGRPIGSFQAIQHYCADQLRAVEGARALLYHATWNMQRGQASAADVAMAKAYASEACLWAARKGHQILGAISYCEEHPLHLLHKRIQAASLDFGDAGLHYETVAQGIGLI
jgi:alkylation response protein AidB-like acyl-CoA dehydrogenase